MISIWEQESFSSFDVIIVGAGISGLSTAASLKERRKDLSILVIERGSLPTGASTKNAGFACFGSISELAQDRICLGDDGMASLVNRRWMGLQKTISRLGADKIGYEQKGGYELLTAATGHYLEDVNEVNHLLRDIFDKPVFSVADDRLRKFGFGHTTHLLFNPYEGQLHTGMLMRSLWQYCSELGIHIITGTPVQQLEVENSTYHVVTDKLTFSARAVALCTNAFTQTLVKQPLDMKPGRGIVMLVTPKKKLPFEGTFHFDEGYYYFRDLRGKLLFGGGRNLDLEGEQTADFGINDQIISKLHEELRTRIIPGEEYSTDLTWSGIMAFGPTKKPILEELPDGIFAGVRLGGMGVAIGSLVGEELAELILDKRF